MPLNIIESMFLSKPVVSSNAGCCSELVTKHDNGYIFYNETEVESVLLSLIRSKDERKRLGENGHKRFLLEHSERTYELYFQFFDN
jgi:glycosyltransferase involved in cell wall biosynthesis